MTVFIILDQRNRVRGFPYTRLEHAHEAVREADATWPKETGCAPHRIVAFAPKPADSP